MITIPSLIESYLYLFHLCHTTRSIPTLIILFDRIIHHIPARIEGKKEFIIHCFHVILMSSIIKYYFMYKLQTLHTKLDYLNALSTDSTTNNVFRVSLEVPYSLLLESNSSSYNLREREREYSNAID